MGLATIDPHTNSHKVQTKLYKIPKFGVIDPIVSKIQPLEIVKIYKEFYGHPDAVSDSIRMAIQFANFDVFKWLFLSQN